MKGQYYKLYQIKAIFSRYLVGGEVRAEETGELPAGPVQRTVLSQRCAAGPLVLHADHGAATKSYSLNAKPKALDIIAALSRPRGSNDDPFSESLFRTLKN